MVYKIQVIIFLVFFSLSCSNSDLDKLSNNLTKEKINDDVDNSSSLNQQPIAIIRIDENVTFRENMDIILDANNSVDTDGKIVSFVWKNGDEIIGSEEQITIQLSSAVYIIELEVEDNQGSKGKVKRQISVDLDFDKIKLNINALEEIDSLKASTKDINQMIIKNNHLYAASNDGNIYFWELLFNKLTDPQSIVVNKDYETTTIVTKKNKLFVGSTDSSITIWDMKTKELLKNIKNHNNAITSSVSNDDIVAFSSIDKSISIVSTSSNELIKTIIGHKSSITSLEIIKNFLVSYSKNKIIKIWNMDKNYRNVSTIDLANDEIDFMLRYEDKLITLSKDGMIIMRDIVKNVILQEKQVEPIRAVSIYETNMIVALDNKDIILINMDDFTDKNLLKLEHKVTSIHTNEGILAIGLDNQEIKIFGNKERFKKR